MECYYNNLIYLYVVIDLKFIKTGHANTFFFVFIFLLFLIVTYNATHDVYHYNQWKVFPDCNDYLTQSKIDLFSLNFWFPDKTPGFSPRPFTVPLIYKLIGDNADDIVKWQKIIHFFSAFLLTFSLSFFIQKQILKYLLAISLFIIFCWWNILGWSQLLLSESLSFSFLLIWISSILFLVKFDDKISFILHILITVLFSFTRDSWPYVLIVFYLLFFLTAYYFLNKKNKKPLLLLLFSFLIFFIQQKSIVKGERHKVPIINNLVVRVLNNPSYLHYFLDNGVPMTNELKQDLKGIDLSNEDNRGAIYDIYNNEKYTPLFNWILKDGKKVYFKFLLLYPSYTLMLNEPESKTMLFFTRNLYSYTKQPIGISLNFESIFPVFSYLALFVFVIILGIMNIKKTNFIHITFIILYITLVINSIMVFNADSLEVARHLFFNSIFVEIMGAISFCFILDSMGFAKYFKKKAN